MGHGVLACGQMLQGGTRARRRDGCFEVCRTPTAEFTFEPFSVPQGREDPGPRQMAPSQCADGGSPAGEELWLPKGERLKGRGF